MQYFAIVPKTQSSKNIHKNISYICLTKARQKKNYYPSPKKIHLRFVQVQKLCYQSSMKQYNFLLHAIFQIVYDFYLKIKLWKCLWWSHVPIRLQTFLYLQLETSYLGKRINANNDLCLKYCIVVRIKMVQWSRYNFCHKIPVLTISSFQIISALLILFLQLLTNCTILKYSLWDR